MMPFAIRVAGAGDLAAVMFLERETGDLPQWTEANFIPYLAQPEEEMMRRCAWLAEFDGVAAGYAVASFLRGDEAAALDSIATGINFRRRGVGAALIREALRWSAGEGAAAMELEVRESNAGARALYASLGFVDEGRRKGYYRQPTEDAVLMGRAVGRVVDVDR